MADTAVDSNTPEPAKTVLVAARSAANLTPQQANNLMLLGLACLVGFLIYLDRRDRLEATALQLRSFESQNELNRQTIALVGERTERAGVAQTQALQTLSLEVGKLQQTVMQFQTFLSKKIE